MRTLALALLALLLTGCTSLVFQPSRQVLFDPTRVGIHPVEDYFPTADGLRLHAWRLPAEGKVKGNVTLVPGNAHNITTHIGSVYWMPHYGFNVYLFDYRGYGDAGPRAHGQWLLLRMNSAMRATPSSIAWFDAA